MGGTITSRHRCRSGGDFGLLAAEFERRGSKFGAEHTPEVRRAVEAIVESDCSQGATALRWRQQGTRAGLEPAAQDVARHGFVLVTEQVMQVTRGHLAG